jgi:hypothetical protein
MSIVGPFLPSKTHSSTLSVRLFSNTTDWWIEEYATREVSIAPLRERCLLLEVTLDSREVLLLQNVMILLISCSEMIIILHCIEGAWPTATHGISQGLSLIVLAACGVRFGTAAVGWVCRVSMLNGG